MNNRKAPGPARPNRINHEIRAPQVRLVGASGEQLGVVNLSRALEEAQASELDLVEIHPQGDPPVCRLMNYGKFLYEKSRAGKLQKKKQKGNQLKEVKFRPVTDIGDYHLKMKQVSSFLEAGDKVKITLTFRGREIVHQELGRQLLERVKADTAEQAVVESQPGRTEGRQLVMLLGPKKKP